MLSVSRFWDPIIRRRVDFLDFVWYYLSSTYSIRVNHIASYGPLVRSVHIIQARNFGLMGGGGSSIFRSQFFRNTGISEAKDRVSKSDTLSCGVFWHTSIYAPSQIERRTSDW